MGKRLLDHDPLTGLKTFHQYDASSDTTVLSYEADAQPILDRNKALQAENTGPMGDGVLAASIPVGVIYEWMTRYGVNLWDKNHLPGVKRLLNSSEYRWLKVREIII